MNERAPVAFWAYLVLQVPDILLAGLIFFALHRWAALSAEWAVGAFVMWIVKDLAMYRVVRSAFAPARTGPETFIGAHGIAEDALDPVGYVKFDGEHWRSESLQPRQVIPAGARVVVRAVQGLTFLVEAETPDAGKSEEGGKSHASRVGEPG